MILVLAAIACVLSVPLTGGRLSRLADLRLRLTWAAPLALALQVVIVTIAPGGDRALHVGVHLATYALGAAFVWVNRRIPGMLVLACGAATNIMAIVANGGVMPASATAQRLAGIAPGGGFQNSAAVAHPHLLWLGDVLPIPGPWPLGNTLSVGDLLLVAGGLLLLHRACSADDAPQDDHVGRAAVELGDLG